MSRGSQPEPASRIHQRSSMSVSRRKSFWNTNGSRCAVRWATTAQTKTVQAACMKDIFQAFIHFFDSKCVMTDYQQKCPTTSLAINYQHQLTTTCSRIYRSAKKLSLAHIVCEMRLCHGQWPQRFFRRVRPVTGHTYIRTRTRALVIHQRASVSSASELLFSHSFSSSSRSRPATLFLKDIA